jgi:hypothetical protein
MTSEQPDWEHCSHDGCIGIQISSTTWCLAHAAELAPDDFNAELKRTVARGMIDARGVVISDELLQRLLAAAPHENDRPILPVALFDRASFQGVARFAGAIFDS